MALETNFDFQALADEIIEAIRREVPAYARPLEGAFGATVRRGVEEALSHFDERAPRATGRSVYVALGRGEAREGRSLEALLAAYRVGARVAWRRLAGAGLEAGLPPERLGAPAEAVFTYIDQLSADSAEGHAQEQARRAGETERRRAALVELLVRDPAPGDAELQSAADAAAWPLPRDVAVLTWDAERGRRPARRLPLGSIAAELDGLMVAVIPDPAAPGRRAELERAGGEVPAALGPAGGPPPGRRPPRPAGGR